MVHACIYIAILTLILTYIFTGPKNNQLNGTTHDVYIRRSVMVLTFKPH